MLWYSQLPGIRRKIASVAGKNQFGTMDSTSGVNVKHAGKAVSTEPGNRVSPH